MPVIALFSLGLFFSNDDVTANVETQPIKNTVYINCLNNAAQKAIVKGAPRDKALLAIDGLYNPDDKIIAASRMQPESNLKIWDYLAGVVDDERAKDGAAAYMSQKDFLYNIGIQYGVDPASVVAIWGVETDYGKVMGKSNIINALGTLGCGGGRRSAYFNSELVEAIRITAEGHVPLSQFNGSWAGAFGHTQFMPSSFWRLAVDGNGDGIKNIVGEPKDALASTANFLKRAGWDARQKWGYEVIVPSGYNGAVGRNATKSLNQWKALGVKLADGNELMDGETKYGLIFPGGHNSPAFLVGRNFNAVYSYNPAISYALAVNILADRIKGGKGVVGKWATNDPGISRMMRREIQQILLSKGYDIGQPDGIIGKKTNDALREYYKSKNLVFDGRLGQLAYDKIKSFEDGR
jgi:lytic murein transglycosylase